MLTLRDEDGNEQTLRVTEEHPFYRDSDGWTPAKSLEAGDMLLGADGTLTVVANEHEAHPNGVTVYNLEVEQAHTYFVLAEDGQDAVAVWVHNRCSGWESDLGEIENRMSRLAMRAIKNSGDDWVAAERTFRKYSGAMDSRLSSSGSPYAVEWQPAAVRDSAGTRTWSAFGENGWSVSPRGSARLDAGIVNLDSLNGTMRMSKGMEMYYPEVVAGFDITVNPMKASKSLYYQSAFGRIPINEFGPKGRL